MDRNTLIFKAVENNFQQQDCSPYVLSGSIFKELLSLNNTFLACLINEIIIHNRYGICNLKKSGGKYVQ